MLTGPDGAGTNTAEQTESPTSRLSTARTAVKLEGRHAVLRPISTQDYESLRIAELSADLVPRWRHEGATPGPEQWVQGLWNGVLAQFLVVTRGQGRPLGLVALYSHDFRNRFAYLAAVKFDVNERSPIFLEGVALFLDYIFTAWDFRKLYLETSEFNLDQFGSGLNWLFTEEGRLRDHKYYAGRYWDQHILAIYRETWGQVAVDVGWLLS